METNKKDTKVNSSLPPVVLSKTTGVAMAAILSVSFGCFIIGLLIVMAVVSNDVKNWLNWWNPAGPLSGKTGVGVIMWLLSWLVLHLFWKRKELKIKPVLAISFILLILGFIFSFPPFFEMFEH